MENKKVLTMLTKNIPQLKLEVCMIIFYIFLNYKDIKLLPFFIGIFMGHIVMFAFGMIISKAIHREKCKHIINTIYKKN